MRLGISSYTYGWAIGGIDDQPPTGAPGALDLIDRAVAMGVNVLQLANNLPVHTWEPASVRKIADKALHAGIALELGTAGCGPDHLRRFIGIASVLGSSILRVVPDLAEDHPSESHVIKRFNAVCGDLEAAHVKLAVENHDRFDTHALCRIVHACRPHVGICLDTVNSFGAMEGPEIVIERLGPLAINLHIKDFAVSRVPYLQGFVIEGRPAGAGMLNVPQILNTLGRFGHDCNAIAELWVPPEPTLAATIEKEAAWAERSVRALRRWIPQ